MNRNRVTWIRHVTVAMVAAVGCGCFAAGTSARKEDGRAQDTTGTPDDGSLDGQGIAAEDDVSAQSDSCDPSTGCEPSPDPQSAQEQEQEQDQDQEQEPDPSDSVHADDSGDASGDADTAPDGDDSAPNTDASLQWNRANLTNFVSYPDPDSEECVKYNGCQWAGQFAALDGQQPESWVMANNIAAVHSRDFETYKLKTLRLRQGSRSIDVTVYDMCADSDCDGCCTKNSRKTKFLIDIESYTAERFGSGDGIVEWACLDCD